MRFSVWLYPYRRWGSIEAMGAAARRAEELAFSSITLSDHTICPIGPEAAGVTPVWYDWSVLATYLAGWTERARLVCCVVLPHRRLLPMAKQIATIDTLSRGRFTLVACAGWLRPEFEMLGVPFPERGAITDEYLRAMKALWTEDAPAFSGRYVSFSDIIFEPKCAQQPHVPIWIGGRGRRPVERVLELGDGWMPMGGSLDQKLVDVVARIKADAGARGRTPEALDFRYTIEVGGRSPALAHLSEIVASSSETATIPGDAPDAAAEVITRFDQAGFTELALNFAGDSAAACLERMEWFAAEVMPLVAC
jgi:probable F420-dependent oxidoreductase